jgi:hypothetical protein
MTREALPDRMLYLVVVEHPTGLLIPETSISDMDRNTVEKDIADGQYDLGDVVAVIELNPTEGICRECTDEFRQSIDRSTDDA